MILTHPGLTKLTFMDYLLTMLRNQLRRKLSYDTSLASQPRCAAAMHCVSYHVYASRTLTHSCCRRFT